MSDYNVPDVSEWSGLVRNLRNSTKHISRVHVFAEFA